MGVEDFRSEVNSYVDEILDGYEPRRYDAPKVIRDAVYGFQEFQPYEMALIDSPLVQRLRGVHQTGLTYFVYPSAHHTRFEHSLGVATKASQMAEHLAEETGLRPVDLLELRMAGLFHDAGHGLFSHLSETIMEQAHPDLATEIREHSAFTEKTHLGEALSALIVRSPSFAHLLEHVKSAYPEVPGLQDVQADRVAWLMLGRSAEPDRQFLADLISGPFDADKLDYLGRDCHFTGIRAEIDWERIIYALAVVEENDRRILAVREAAVPHLEQILFSKMLMYTSVYHHHKIRALESMVRGVFEVIQEDPGRISMPEMRFLKITDILRVSEEQFFAAGRTDPALAHLIGEISERRLLQRALIINLRTVDSEDVGQFRNFQKLSVDPAGLGMLRLISRTIMGEIPEKHQHGDEHLWLDFPKSPDLSAEAEECRVTRGAGETESLKTFFRSGDWVGTYVDNKLAAHLFYVPDVDARRAAADAANEVLGSLYRIKLHESARRAIR